MAGPSVRYRRVGSGPPLVLIHGLGGSGRWWRPVLPALGARHSLVVVDLPGFGRSRGQRPDLDAAADILDRLLDHLGIACAAVMGHSMGGYVAASLAARHPDRVDRLVLVDSAGLAFESSYRRHVVAILRTLPRLPPVLAATAALDALRVGPFALGRAAHRIVASDLSASLRDVQAPTLVVWGSRDRLIEPETGERLVRTLPRAAFAVIPGAGHSPMWERPRDFADLVVPFLAAADPGAHLDAMTGPAAALRPGVDAAIAVSQSAADGATPAPGAPRSGDPSLRRRYVKVGGLELHVREGGPARRDAGSRAIVLVHGFVISSRYMVPVGRLLARRHRVLAPDLPGFGWSSHPPAVLAVPALAEVLARFIELEVRGPAVVLGNSFGCQVSAQLAADRPDLVDRLILVSPTFDPHASLLRHVLRLLGDAPRERLDLWLLQVPDYVLAGPRTIIGTLRAARRHRIERVLPHIPAPTLVVRGSRDTIVPAAWAAEAASLLPEGAAEELPGAPHASNHSAPVALAEAVERFLVDP